MVNDDLRDSVRQLNEWQRATDDAIAELRADIDGMNDDIATLSEGGEVTIEMPLPDNLPVIRHAGSGVYMIATPDSVAVHGDPLPPRPDELLSEEQVDMDERLKVSDNDTLAEYLEEKLIGDDGTGTNLKVTLTPQNEGGVEQLKIIVEKTDVDDASSDEHIGTVDGDGAGTATDVNVLNFIGATVTETPAGTAQITITDTNTDDSIGTVQGDGAGSVTATDVNVLDFVGAKVTETPAGTAKIEITDTNTDTMISNVTDSEDTPGTADNVTTLLFEGINGIGVAVSEDPAATGKIVIDGSGVGGSGFASTATARLYYKEHDGVGDGSGYAQATTTVINSNI